MPFISRKDQVHPCHMSPGKHSVNRLLKTPYDEDATTFPATLFLMQTLQAVIWPIALFPILPILHANMGMKTRLFPSLFLSSYLPVSCLLSSQFFRLSHINSFSKAFIIICTSMSAGTYVNMYGHVRTFWRSSQLSGVGHGVIRTATSLKVLPA